MILTRRQLITYGAACFATAAGAGQVPLVFAAASLKSVLDDLATTLPMRLNYAGSGVLARQITLGAPADLFISANPVWMDVVAEAGWLAKPPVSILGNRLVVIGKSDKPEFTLQDLTKGARVAIGLVEAVPAGQYAKSAFQTLGLWDQIEPMTIQTENVRAAMALVSRGEVPYGVVYKTDALADNSVKVLADIPADSHPQITYQAGLINGSQARDTFERLGMSGEVFERHGFIAL